MFSISAFHNNHLGQESMCLNFVLTFLFFYLGNLVGTYIVFMVCISFSHFSSFWKDLRILLCH